LKPREDIIVIADEVIHDSSGIGHFQDPFEYLPMGRREILFPELPGINDVSIKDQSGGLYLMEIFE
jgi:hypothetical protein